MKKPLPQPQPLTENPPYWAAKRNLRKKPVKTPLEIVPQIPSITFNSPSLSEAKTLFNQPISYLKNTLYDLRLCNSVLQSFSSISTLQDSICFLNHMIKSHPSFSPDTSTYNILLVQFSKADEFFISSVHWVLNYMSSQGFPPNKVSIDIVVRTLCACGHEEDAIELVKDLSAKNWVPDSYTYNFLVRQLVKNRELSTVNGFIKEMREGFDVKRDLVRYTFMIDNVYNRKNLREATRLLGALNEDGYKPDCFVYNTIMKGRCMLSQSSEVLDVYKKMKEEGVEPDIVTYSTLIYGLSKSGRVKEGTFSGCSYLYFFDEWNVQGRDSLGALALFGEMEAKGCVPNSCTYNTLLHRLCKEQLLDKGIELYKVMQEGGMKLETGSYGTFARALCRNGRVDEAYDVFDYGVESKSRLKLLLIQLWKVLSSG